MQQTLSPFGTNHSVHPFRRYQTVSPFVMVVFGATGDLTATKLMPALFNLLKKGVLPDRFFVVGVARRPFSHEEFRDHMRQAMIKGDKGNKGDIPDFDKVSVGKDDTEVWEKLEKNLYYQQGLFEEVAPFEDLVRMLKTFDDEVGACITRFFYLATPPQNYSVIISNLDKAKLDEGCGQGSSKWTRILIEKPFGKDQGNARRLEEQLASTFEDRQIYRIDHYLAKETIQNILAFRFANRLFEPLWNKNHIDNIQFTLFEEKGIGTRGSVYEGMGALRDIFQNHLMAMIAYIAMEEPEGFNAENIRKARVAALRNLKSINPDEADKYVVRGQYDGYRSEKNVDPNSCTETYVAAKLEIDNPRWQGVPFYVRTGKKMRESQVRIDIVLKSPMARLYNHCEYKDGVYVCNIPKRNTDGNSIPSVQVKNENVITIHVQPREGISIRFSAKSPGLTYDLMPVEMEFDYSRSFRRDISDSYEKILIDAMTGDQTLFATSAGFGVTWELANNIMIGWEPRTPKFPNYEAGTWGPKEGDLLIQKDGRRWILG